MAAPAALASLGKISGLGLAMAKIMAFGFMDLTMGLVRRPARETPIKTSESLIASGRDPEILLGLVILRRDFLTGFKSLRPRLTMPLESTMTMCLKP